MKNAIGHTRWAIAEGYIPDSSKGPEPEMTSHETVCLLNTSDSAARSKSQSSSQIGSRWGRM
jgi:hypothetical protein